MLVVTPVQQVEQDANDVVRHQPRAHAFWQFSYRNARFRNAIARLEKALFALTVDTFSDDDLQLLVEVTATVIKVIEVHMSRLGGGVRDVIDREYFKKMIKSLEFAKEGLEQGLAPDPAKRPTRDQLLDEMAAMLEKQGPGRRENRRTQDDALPLGEIREGPAGEAPNRRHVCLPISLIDEVAAVNDSMPIVSRKQRKREMLHWLRWRLGELGMPGFVAKRNAERPVKKSKRENRYPKDGY